MEHGSHQRSFTFKMATKVVTGKKISSDLKNFCTKMCFRTFWKKFFWYPPPPHYHWWDSHFVLWTMPSKKTLWNMGLIDAPSLSKWPPKWSMKKKFHQISKIFAPKCVSGHSGKKNFWYPPPITLPLCTMDHAQQKTQWNMGLVNAPSLSKWPPKWSMKKKFHQISKIFAPKCVSGHSEKKKFLVSTPTTTNTNQNI